MATRGRKPAGRRAQFNVEQAFASLNSTISDQNEKIERLQNLQHQFMGTARQQQQEQHDPVRAVGELSFDGLPDPTMNPTEYQVEVSKRTAAYAQRIAQATAQAETSRATTQQEQSRDLESRVNNLWKSFGDEYPELAHEKDIVELKAREYVAEMASQGLDVQQAMFGDSKRFMKELAKRSKDRLTKLGWKDTVSANAEKAKKAQIGMPMTLGSEDADEDDGDDDTAQVDLDADDDSDDNGRAGSLFGGFTQDDAPVAKKGKKGEGSLVDEIKAQQRQMKGIF